MLPVLVIGIVALIYQRFCKWWNMKHPPMKHSKGYRRWRRKRLAKMSADDMIGRMKNIPHNAAIQPWPDESDRM